MVNMESRRSHRREIRFSSIVTVRGRISRAMESND